MNHSHNTDKIRRLARAVIAVDDQTFRCDSTPDDSEVRLWVRGQVSHERAEQLTLHALDDPLLMQRFRELQIERDCERSTLMRLSISAAQRLEEISHEFRDNVRTRFASQISFGSSAGNLVGGLAAVCLVIGIAAFTSGKPISATQRAWNNDSVIKSSVDSPSPTTLFDENVAVLQGINDTQPHIIYASGIQTEKLIFAACAVADGPCQERLATLRSIGQLAARTDQHCRSGERPDTDVAPQLRAGIDILTQHPASQPLLAPLQRWYRSNNVQQQCASAAQLIERAVQITE